MEKKIVRRVAELEDTVLADLPLLLRQIYRSRKIMHAHELQNTLDRLLPYQSLLNIEEAVVLLAEHLAKKSTLLIVGDFDADGATSTALAVRALQQFGAAKVAYLVPNRFEYGYGLTPELVADAVKYEPHLIITVDNGIANHAGVAAAKAHNIQVLITDHHLPAATLPNADVIINPNQAHDPFPSKNLAGVGVIFYVMLALRRHLLTQNWFKQNFLPEPNMARFLDLVALGTVADLVPLDQNNRILVHHGLQRIRAGQCVPGIVALLETANRDFTRISTSDLGFAVGARLNAAGRLDDMALGIECLLTDDTHCARQHAQTLNQLNLERRIIEKDMQMQALQSLNKVANNLQTDLPHGLCLYDDTWHQGVIGILASRIKDKFNRPVIVFAPGANGELKGSARSIHGLHIRDVLARIATQHPELILKFGGHAMAAGLTIAKHLLNDFEKIFNHVVSQNLSETDLQHLLFSDGELQGENLSLETACLLRDSGPWGQAFPEPAFDNIFTIVDQRLIKDKHLKLRVEIDNKIVDAMAFFVDTKVWPDARCAKIHALYRLDINEWQGKSRLQLLFDYLTPV